MFEDQQEKFFDRLVGIVNRWFSKQPLISSVVASAIVCVSVIVIVFSYHQSTETLEVSTMGKIDEVGEGSDKSVGLGFNEGSGEVVVDLSGAVKNPGIYRLPSNSRLSDLLVKGGGFVSDVSYLWVSRNLNLASNVFDGDKIYIPFDWDIEQGNVQAGNTKIYPLVFNIDQQQPTPPDSVDVIDAQEDESSDNLGRVNVNTVTESDLDLLPGVGPAYAKKIVDGRPYTSYDDFKLKSGLSASLAENLKELIGY